MPRNRKTLTEKQVRIIKSVLHYLKQEDIAKIFNVSQPTISLINRKRTWTDIWHY